MTDVGDAGFAMRKKCLIAGRIVPIIRRAIKKMVTGGGVEGMVRRTDPAECGDVGEFSNPRVGDVGITVAVGVIPERRVVQPTATPDFDIGAKGCLLYTSPSPRD